MYEFKTSDYAIVRIKTHLRCAIEARFHYICTSTRISIRKPYLFLLVNLNIRYISYKDMICQYH